MTRRKKRSTDDSSLPHVDIFLNPARAQERDDLVASQRALYRASFSSMNLSASHGSLFELLWYSNNIYIYVYIYIYLNI